MGACPRLWLPRLCSRLFASVAVSVRVCSAPARVCSRLFASISFPKLLYVPGNSPLVPGPALALADVGHKGTPPYRSFVLTQNQRLSSVAVLWDLTRVYIRLKKNAHPSSRLGTHVLSALPFHLDG